MVVSSETPLMAWRCLTNQPGDFARRFLIWAKKYSSSSEVGALDQVGLALLDARADQDVHRGVAAIVEDHVRAALEIEDAVGVAPVFLERLALDREDRHAGFRDRGRRVVLGGIDVARGPADLRSKRRQRLDQHGGLDRHVERTRDPRALERLRSAELLAQRHQARHLRLGDVEFLAAVFRQSDVFYHVIQCHDRPTPDVLCGFPAGI